MNCAASLNNFDKKIKGSINGKSSVDANIVSISITSLIESPLMIKVSAEAVKDFNLFCNKKLSLLSEGDIQHQHEWRPHHNYHDFDIKIDITDFEACLQLKQVC